MSIAHRGCRSWGAGKTIGNQYSTQAIRSVENRVAAAPLVKEEAGQPAT
jgi:hypothetical protein